MPKATQRPGSNDREVFMDLYCQRGALTAMQSRTFSPKTFVFRRVWAAPGVDIRYIINMGFA